MKIIEPSATIIEDELSWLRAYKRIDKCASICYQRPEKVSEGEAIEFCQKILDNKHDATLEMFRINLLVTQQQAECLATEKYITISKQVKNGMVIASGSIRAWMESTYISEITNLLHSHFPLFFKFEYDITPWEDIQFIHASDVPIEHQHVAVHFIINRIVSHQLIRHRPCAFLQES